MTLKGQRACADGSAEDSLLPGEKEKGPGSHGLGSNISEDADGLLTGEDGSPECYDGPMGQAEPVDLMTGPTGRRQLRHGPAFFRCARSTWKKMVVKKLLTRRMASS